MCWLVQMWPAHVYPENTSWWPAGVHIPVTSWCVRLVCSYAWSHVGVRCSSSCALLSSQVFCHMWCLIPHKLVRFSDTCSVSCLIRHEFMCLDTMSSVMSSRRLLDRLFWHVFQHIWHGLDLFSDPVSFGHMILLYLNKYLTSFDAFHTISGHAIPSPTALLCQEYSLNSFIGVNMLFSFSTQPWQSEEEGSWLREYPVTLMQFFRYLYHNVPDLVSLWMSPEFLCALAATVFPFNIRPYSEMVGNSVSWIFCSFSHKCTFWGFISYKSHEDKALLAVQTLMVLKTGLENLYLRFESERGVCSTKKQVLKLHFWGNVHYLLVSGRASSLTYKNQVNSDLQ